jgi:hypothetical protein
MGKFKNGNSLLRLWMRDATAGQQERLARAADSSRGQLYQVAGGFRRFGPAKAAAIERESALLSVETGGRLPKLYRPDLAIECAGCDYARQCLGAVAGRADFVALEDDADEAGAVD